MLKQLQWRPWATANWFLLAAPFLLLISFLFTRSADWETSGAAAEAVTLFDWCVSIPLLYFLCYRKRVPAKQMLLRLVGLACLGVWIAARLVPDSSEHLLPQLGWARTAGLAVLVLIELRLLIAVLKIAFSGRGSSEELVKMGAPPLVAKLMLLEAAFWRAVWRLIRGR